MSYLLPRLFIVLMAWGMTCGMIENLWRDADPMIFGIVGLTWVGGGIAYFVYLRRLRRDIAELERNRGYSISRTAG
jgi:ABC-type polysaccharide/polyol phosphate export permease